jgi:hypothetical protein
MRKPEWWMPVMVMEMHSHETYGETSDEKMTVCLYLKFVKIHLLQFHPHHLKSLAVMEVFYAWHMVHKNPTNQTHS